MTLSDRPAQVGGTLRVFSGSLATETNTFGPMPTGLSSFKERAYYRADTHPDRMQMHSGPLWAAREAGPAKGWTLIEGLVAASVPNGIVNCASADFTSLDMRDRYPQSKCDGCRSKHLVSICDQQQHIRPHREHNV